MSPLQLFSMAFTPTSKARGPPIRDRRAIVSYLYQLDPTYGANEFPSSGRMTSNQAEIAVSTGCDAATHQCVSVTRLVRLARSVVGGGTEMKRSYSRLLTPNLSLAGYIVVLIRKYSLSAIHSS